MWRSVAMPHLCDVYVTNRLYILYILLHNWVSPVWFGKTGLHVVSLFFEKAKNSNFILWVRHCQVRIYLYFEGQRFLKTPQSRSQRPRSFWSATGIGTSGIIRFPTTGFLLSSRLRRPKPVWKMASNLEDSFHDAIKVARLDFFRAIPPKFEP